MPRRATISDSIFGRRRGGTTVSERFYVEGGARLEGEVEVSGAKNAALKFVAAALLAPGKTVLHGVPRIKDIWTMISLLDELGVRTSFSGHTLEIDASGVDSYTAPYELVRGFIKATAPGGLKGTEIVFEYPSVGATENVMMASVLAEGVTIIENAAREPEIVAIADMLNAMGASVMGAGTGRIVVEGVEGLGAVEWTVMPDRIEAGTFLMAAAATGGDVLVKNADPALLKMELDKMRGMGVEIEASTGSPGIRARVRDPASLVGADVSTLPFPGFAT